MNPNTKELRELLEFGFLAGDAVEMILADGKLTLGDLFHLDDYVDLYKAAKAAIDDLGNPLDRLKALSAADGEELLAYVRDRFDLPDDELEGLLEDCVQFAVAGVAIVTRWRNRRKTPQA